MTLTMRGIVAVLSSIMFLRGVDYLSNDRPLIGTNQSELVTMPHLWGAAFLVAAGFGVFAALKNTLLSAVNFGVVGAAITAMFAIQVFQMDMLPYPWPPEDIRVLGDGVGLSTLFVVVALSSSHRMGVDKRKRELIGELDG